MKAKSSSQIRKEFLDFFESKGHTVKNSYSLIPEDDPSILLVGAGMAPLKKYFTGQATPPNVRMATCQKCVRVGDIDEVGKTARHLTFFEMLGNFSFGEYFKKESLAWGMEFLEDWMEIPRSRLWASVYEEDDEAYEIWKNEIKLPEERIVRLGKEHNFWEIGLGPSGPCSEIYYDRGPEYGCGDPDHKPGCECDQFIEIWNHVFTQYDKQEDGSYKLLESKNIDTGMGLERLAMVLQEKNSVYEIDLMDHLLTLIGEIVGLKYPVGDISDMRMRIIADHARSMTFLVSDGVVPSNEGRGYVLRKLIRRASLQLYLLGQEKRYLKDLAKKSIEIYEEGYPELRERKDTILHMIDLEEEKFHQTLRRGMNYLDEISLDMQRKGQTILDGERAFRLYDTYGFPLSLTEEILEEAGFGVDLEGFDKYMQKQRETSRALVDKEGLGWKGDLQKYLKELEPTTFLGYDQLEVSAKVLEIIVDNELRDTLHAGEKGQVIFDRTPFYATGGGQVGDWGYIESEHNLLNVSLVEQTEKLYFHQVSALRGELRKGDIVSLVVDKDQRMSTARNHSATHLLHQALINVLGEGVQQAGSLVDENRLRFDFNYFEPMTAKQLREVEAQVNENILSDHQVRESHSELEEAKRQGAKALFSEKYDDEVRVISMGTSVELCGGTHVEHSSQIGLFILLSERGIASGVRRIEAITGQKALDYVASQNEVLEEAAGLVKGRWEELPQKLAQLQEEKKELEQTVRKLKDRAGSDIIKDMVSERKSLDDIYVYVKKFEDQNIDGLKLLADQLQAQDPQGLVFLASSLDNKITMVAAAGDKSRDMGYKAGRLVSKIAKELGGGGGGRDHFATAGARDLEKLDGVLENILDILEESRN